MWQRRLPLFYLLLCHNNTRKTFSLQDKMPFETKGPKSTSISVRVKRFPAAQAQTRHFDEHDEETERPRVRGRELESHPGMTLAV